ncbi:GNAT family N-acetyltransferase [Agromyces sp. MMS24-JH15]|uniref:GNAT family N-acetyltransferase n=1 Tax=Agromyces sp. MMS24-JH15 TaxID=3243765 RepID=UPI00374A2835
MSFDPHRIPLDRAAAIALRERGLEYRLLDAKDTDALTRWVRADFRGFHQARPHAGELDAQRRVFGERRLQGVYDPASADPDFPVATVSGWPTGLSMPGGRSIDAWAVSSVTVAPTHRRRGIARALMEAELANARAAGAAVAVLTATEATIYGRFGYAPAARAATLEIDRSRVHWTGRDAPGRCHLVEPASLAADAPAVARRAVARTAGEIDRWPGLLDHVLGLVDPESESARHIRAVRYDDERGQAQGFATYRVRREPDRPGVLEVGFFAAATDDAERAMWRVLCEHDFITRVRAPLRSVDEPISWLVEDPRAISFHEVGDHLWVRVLDPVAALAGRRFGGPGSLVLEVRDPLGHAAGSFEVEADGEGRPEVRRLDGADAATASSGRRNRRQHGIGLGVQELGSILLGGVRPTTLGRAGRISEHARGSLALADRLFAAEREPLLSIWF